MQKYRKDVVMMFFNTMHTTNLGDHLSTSLMAGETLAFTKIGIGAGDPISREQVKEMTTLIDPRAYFPITDVIDNKDGTVVVRCNLVNKDVEERFYIKEIGIYAQDPNRGEILYGVIACGDAADLFSAKTDKLLSITNDILVKVTDAKNVTFVISDSLVWATKQDLLNLAGTGRTDETVKKNADDIKALDLKIMMLGTQGSMGGLDENTGLITFEKLAESEEFWGYYDEDKRRLVG